MKCPKCETIIQVYAHQIYCPKCNKWDLTPVKGPNEKLEKAKRELEDFTKLISEEWDEDFSDVKELLCLKFYKAGIKMGEKDG